MHFGAPLFLFISLCACVSQVTSAPGRWEQLVLSEGKVFNLADVGFSPVHVHSLIFGIQACEELIITFSEVLDNSKGYVMVYLGFQQNNYTLLIPSTHCDDTGQCTPTDYVPGKFLDCDNPRYYWLKWDNHGILELGDGFMIGENLILHTNYSGEFNLNSVTFRVNHVHGGVAVVNIDSRPEFIAPSPDGTHNIVVDETSETGMEIYTIEAIDPEDDNMTFTVVGDYSDMFNITRDRLYNTQPLDFESRCAFDVTISASDQAGDVNTTLTIRIGDVIDEPPQLFVSPVAIPEELAVGTAIDGGFVVRDQDANDTEHFFLTGPHSDYFEILEDWKFEIKKRIDFESGDIFLDQLILTVVDSADLNNSAVLNITILDMNDNPPFFSAPVYSTSVTEHSPDGVVITLTCNDADSGDNGNINVTMATGYEDSNGPMFTFDSVKLELRALSSKIDYESLADKNYTYVISFMAVDTPTSDMPNTAFATVIVRVLPDNDNEPNWTQSIDSLVLPETAPPGTLVTTFIATDDDHGADGDITYSITSVKAGGSDVPSVFKIDSGSGNLTIAGDLDADIETGGVAAYVVTIQAADGGNPPKKATKTVNFTLKAENDNRPDFTNTPSSATIAEDANVGTQVCLIFLKDKDAFDTLSVTLSGDGSDVFQINDSHILTVKSSLDYETKSSYSVLINATDGKYFVTKGVTIFVSDVNDESPVITVFSPLSLPEKLPSLVLGKLYDVVDNDVNETLKYSLTGKDAKYFRIHPQTGTLALAGMIDRDAGITSLDDLHLTVTDSAGNKANASLPITITDVTDDGSRPNCSADVKVVNLTENTPADTVLCTLTCVGVSDSSVMLNVVSGDPAGTFTTKENTVTTSSTPIDFESLPDGLNTYTLVVSASTGSPSTVTFVVVVQVLGVNEHDPTIDGIVSPLKVFVGEDLEPGGAITMVNASDKDAGPDGDVMFKLKDVLDGARNPAPGTFTIDPNTGILSTVKVLDSDAETGGVLYYNVTVEAYDQGMTSKEVTLLVVVIINNVNDNPPYFYKLQREVVVAEDFKVGNRITSFAGKDADGDNVTLSIIDGDSDYFSMDGSAIKLEKELDFETQNCYNVLINMFDGKYNVSKTVVIKVGDVIDETPQIVTFTPAHVLANLPVGTVIGGLFTVSDADRRDNLIYSLSGDMSSFLAINSSTGEIRIKQSLTSLRSMYLDQVTLTVEDQAGLNDTQQLNITVVTAGAGGDAPTFTQFLYNANVTENSQNVTLLALSLLDNDAVTNGDVTISVWSGDPARVFSLSGLELQVTGSVDFESLEEQDYRYSLTVKARSKEGAEGAAVVVVKVWPQNDNLPVWSDATSGNVTEMSIFENVTVGTVVTAVKAIDADSGDDGSITYSIASTTSSEQPPVEQPPFALDPVSGELRVISNLDRDLDTGGVEFYTVIIQAKDGGQPTNKISRKLKITLLDVSDSAPTVDTSALFIRVREDISVGSKIFTFASGSYSVVGGDDAYFQVVKGSVTTIKELDYENRTLYSVIVSDGKSDSNTSVTVYVDDVIDEVPVLTIFEPVYIQEELEVNTTLGGIFSATDRDKGDMLTFSLQGKDSKYFRFNTSTNELQITERINRDWPTSVVKLTNITLTVKDSAGLSTSKTFTVNIQDIDDNPPVFSQIYYYTTVEENSTYGNILNLSFTDVDMTSGGNYDLNIVDGNTDSLFNLTNTMLAVDGSRLDYETGAETGNTYTLTVMTSGGAMTGTTVIVVVVEPKNEFKPTWVTPVAGQGVVSVYENTTVGTAVVTLVVSDPDMGDDGTLIYEITDDGNSGVSTFTLDERTGVIRLSGTLDYDSGTGGSDAYFLSVKVSDKGTPPKSIEGKVRVLVRNNNDNAPSVTSSVRSIRVLENSTIGDELITIPTEDLDGDTVTLNIVAGEGGIVEVKGFALILQVPVKSIPGSCPTIVIRVSDGVLYTDYSYLIQVTSANVNAPNIKYATSYSIPEEIPVGTILGGLITVFSDGGSELHFAIKEKGKSFLEINYKTGALKLKERIDRDGVTGMTSLNDMFLSVTDNLGRTIGQSINITITDINDNVPTFNQSVYSVTVKENSPDGSVLTVSCEDIDSGQNGVFVMSLQGDTKNGVVYLVGNTVSVKSSGLDFDAMSDDETYMTLTLEAVDQANDFPRFTSQATVLIQIEPVNEFKPVIDDPALEVKVNEDVAVGAVLASLTAVDNDRGVDGQLTYSLISVLDDNTNDATDKFEITPTTGELRPLVGLDTDTSTGGVNSYIVTYKVSDGGVPSKETQGQITLSLVPVNEHTPALQPSRETMDIKEDAAMSTVVYTFAATDADGDNVTFSVSGNLFRFKGADLTLSQKLDYNADNCKIFTVSASDGKLSSSVSFSLNVIKANVSGVAAPNIRALSSPTIIEEQPLGTIVSLFQSVQGGNPPLVYTLSGYQADYFTIDSGTGIIKLAKFVDFDGQNGTQVLDQVTLTVEDSTGLKDWVTFKLAVVDLNDNSPVCPQSTYAIEVAENSPKGKKLGVLNCYDTDGDAFGKFSASLAGDGVLDSFFTISGLEIFTSDTKADYEAMTDDVSDMIRVILTDNPDGNVHLSTTIFVTVQITPENEFPPVWNSTFADITVYENVTIGTAVAVYSATDKDLGQDGRVTYMLKSVKTDTGADVTSLFSVDYDTGTLRTADILDADTGSTSVTYNVVVVAQDQGYVPNTIERTQKIVVVNSNDNPPTLGSAEQQISIYENASIGDVIYTLAASDVDGDPVTFKVIGDLLKVVGSTLVLNQSLDFEKERCTTIEIIAMDDKFTVKSTVIINVLNINDETPVIQTYGLIGILEEQPIGTLVGGAFTVIDRDEGDVLTYTLDKQGGLFSINSTTGRLTINRSVDFEKKIHKSELSTKVKVTDAVGHVATAILEFSVTDINDNAPACPRHTYEINVTENKDDNSTVLTLPCTDADAGSNGELTLTITKGNDKGLFNVNGLKLAVGTVDYDHPDLVDFTYTLTIAVSDSSTNEARRTAYVVVVVNLQSSNEFDPYWMSPVIDDKGQFPSLSVQEDIKPGTVIQTFTSSDQDRGRDGQIKYSIASVTSDTGVSAMDLFSIDENTGSLMTTSALDYDVTTGGSTYYRITISAVDTATSPRSTSGLLILNLTDYNDNPPKFTKTLYSVRVTCDKYNGDTLAMLSATDADSTVLKYAINGSSRFVYVDLDTGGIILLYTPEEHAMKDVSSDIFVVVVSDRGNGKRGNPDLRDHSTAYLVFDDCSRPTVSTTTTTTTTTTEATTVLQTGNLNKTSSNQYCSQPRGQVLEIWATRTICGMLALGLVCLLIYHVKTSRPRVAPEKEVKDIPPKKKQGPLSMLERGDNSDKKIRIEDLLNNESELSSSAPVGHPKMRYEP